MNNGRFYMMMNAPTFNELATQAGADFLWQDGRPGTAENGFLEAGEIQYLSPESKSRYENSDGTYTDALGEAIIQIVQPSLLTRSVVAHYLVDKSNNGEKANDLELPLKDCEKNPPRDPGLKFPVGACKDLVRRSIEPNRNSPKSGLSLGGDLHGLGNLFPRMQLQGFTMVYTNATDRPARSIGPDNSPVTHGYHLEDVCLGALSPYLQDPIRSNREFLEDYNEEARRSGLLLMQDFPFSLAVPNSAMGELEGYTVLDAGLVFCNRDDNPLPIASALEERRTLGLGQEQYDDHWRHRVPDDSQYYFAHGSPLNQAISPTAAPRFADDYYWTITDQQFFGLFVPNLKLDSIAMQNYERALWDKGRAFSAQGGWRFDALHFKHEDPVLDIAKTARLAIPGPEHVVGECVSAGMPFDYSGRCIQSFLLQEDPLKRVEILFHGASSALRGVFANDRTSLANLSLIDAVYERYDHDPRVTTGLTLYIDNHDDPEALSETSGIDPIRRMSFDDLEYAYLSLAETGGAIHIYYPTLAMVRDRGERRLQTPLYAFYRPHFEYPTSTDPATLNSMEQTVATLSAFRKDHFKAIQFGVRQVQTPNDYVHIVYKTLLDDEMAVVTLRSRNPKGLPEDELFQTSIPLPAGIWRDRVTGQEFKISPDGEVSQHNQEGFDTLKQIPLFFDERGHRSYGQISTCEPNAFGADRCFEINGAHAALPDGRWMPVNPPESGTCDPRAIFEGPSKGRYSGHHPYEGCATIITQGGLVSDLQVPEDAKVSLRRIDDNTATLPDGQYYLDRGGADCPAWVLTSTHKEGYHVAEVCGSRGDEILRVEDGSVRLFGLTRVMLLERVTP